MKDLGDTLRRQRSEVRILSGAPLSIPESEKLANTLNGKVRSAVLNPLARSYRRGYGWLRTGGRIRERIDLHLRGYDTTNESSGVFVWKKGHVADVLPYRPSAQEESRRAISDISLAELAWVVIDNQDLLEMPDPARDMARLLGVKALAASARARLDEAIARARIHLAAQDRSA